MCSPKNKLVVVLLSIVSLASVPAFSATTAVYNQMSPVYQSIQADAQNCASGTVPGTVGYSIHQAQQVHTTLASARPNTESLFDVSSDCFSGLTKLMDLSFAIPSLASILGAVEQAVLDYAQKKVCTAVFQATSMVTSPINQAIQDVNSLQGFTNLNGMSNGLIASGMKTIDPQLGAQYQGAPTSGNYTLNTTQYAASQTQFSTSNTTNNLNGSISNLQSLNTQALNLQNNQLPQAQSALAQAQSNLSQCQSAYYQQQQYQGYQGQPNCSSEEQQVQSAQDYIDTLNAQLQALIAQLNAAANASAPQQKMAAPAPSQSTGNTGLLDNFLNLFN